MTPHEGKNLRSLRRSIKLQKPEGRMRTMTQDEFASIVGVDRRTVIEWEKSAVIPNRHKDDIARAFKKSRAELDLVLSSAGHATHRYLLTDREREVIDAMRSSAERGDEIATLAQLLTKSKLSALAAAVALLEGRKAGGPRGESQERQGG